MTVDKLHTIVPIEREYLYYYHMSKITLRPHQERILDRMLAYNKGQVIVPTGGGKTLTMIVDTQRRHDVINNGTTTVVVAPRL